jgi:hypothetical protein
MGAEESPERRHARRVFAVSVHNKTACRADALESRFET